jgi:hypothetical protein
MRRGLAIVLAILVVLTLVGVGVGAYHAGVDEGIRRTADAGQVVEVVGGYGWRGGGFFPFGLILFPLFVFGIVALVGGAFRRRAWGGPGGWGGGPGAWRTEGGRHFEERFQEWHARQHEQGSSSAAVAHSEEGSSSAAVAHGDEGAAAPDPGSGS